MKSRKQIKEENKRQDRKKKTYGIKKKKHI